MIRLAAFLQLLPLVLGIIRPKWIDSARAWVILCFTMGFVVDMAAYDFSHFHHLYNHIIYQVGFPLEAGLALMALSCWERPGTRRAYRIVIPVLVAVSFLITGLIENVNTFSGYAAPLVAVALIGACAWTMVRCADRAIVPLYRHDWFWACAGWTLEYGAHGMVTPAAGALLATDPTFAIRVYLLAGWVSFAGELLVIVALLCPPSPDAQGG